MAECEVIQEPSPPAIVRLILTRAEAIMLVAALGGTAGSDSVYDPLTAALRGADINYIQEAYRAGF